MAHASEPTLTRDTFFDGGLRVRQSRSGYRFSIDAVLLAHQVRPRPADKVLDLGTGCGVIPLILCYRHAGVSVWGVEIQTPLADLARRNVSDNRLQERISILNLDFRRLNAADLPGPFDFVVANPPYRRKGSGRVNPNGQRAAARHEIAAGLDDVLGAARRMLRTGGRFVIIYAAERAVDILAGMRTVGIEPKCLRTVHSAPRTAAKLVLIEGVQGARSGIGIASPLVIYRPDGGYSDEVAAMLQA